MTSTSSINCEEVSYLTLIITEVSSLGIVMVGDTAQTIDSVNSEGLIVDRAFFGLVRVLPVHKLQAGLSYWGWAKMPPNADNGRWMDWWLQNIIDRRANDYDTLDELACLLQTELRRVVPWLSDEELEVIPFGSGEVHLAGFVDLGRTRAPSFWHIHNGGSQTLPSRRIDPHIVNANHDCPPRTSRRLFREEQSYVTRNGDIEAYGRFLERHLMAYVKELGRELGYVVPIPSLGTRAEFRSAQIRFISALYEASGVIEDCVVRQMTKGIGDQVTTLAMTSERIQSYYTR